MNSYDLQINKGETFTMSFNVTDASGNPVDLTGYTMSGALKFNYSTGFLSDLGAQITIPQSGQVTLTIPYTVTATFPVTVAPYDVFMLNGPISTKVLAGNAIIYPDVAI